MSHHLKQIKKHLFTDMYIIDDTVLIIQRGGILC